MKTDENGCSTCPKGEEQWEEIRLPQNRRIKGVQYDYRDGNGDLFSTVAINLAVARNRRNEWLTKKSQQTEKKNTGEWFYPIQENLLARLHGEYNQFTCLFQDVLSNRVYEAYQCYNSESELPVILMAVLNKQTGRFHLYKMIER